MFRNPAAKDPSRVCQFCDAPIEPVLERCGHCGAAIPPHTSKRVPLSTNMAVLLGLGVLVSGLTVTYFCALILLSLATPPGNPLSPNREGFIMAGKCIGGGMVVFLACLVQIIHGGRRR